MTPIRRIAWKTVSCATGLLLLRAAIVLGAPPTPSEPAVQALAVVRAYLQALHARDPRGAYRLISAADRRIRDEKTYLKSTEASEGFALALAQQLAAGLEVRVIEQHTSSTRARFEVSYRVPTGDELSAQLFDWNATKLNALPLSQQRQLGSALAGLKQRGRMISLEGQETFRLVREKSGWKIFLDWASRTRVIFKSLVPRSGELAVRFARNDFLVDRNEPLQINFTLKNRATHAIVIQLNHLIAPRRFADHVEMIACGSLAPVRLGPGEERETSSAYILSAVPARSRVAIVYDFSVAAATDWKEPLSRQESSP